MSVFDGKRLGAETFKLDVARMRRGWYSDKYFDNIVTLLTGLVREGYTFAGHNAALEDKGLRLSDVHTGDIEVEMQWFTRRQPFSVVAGEDKALAMLKECTGHFRNDGDSEPVQRFRDAGNADAGGADAEHAGGDERVRGPARGARQGGPVLPGPLRRS